MANEGETQATGEVTTQPVAGKRPKVERAMAESPLGLSGPAGAPAPRADASKASPAVAAAEAQPEAVAKTYEVLEDREVPQGGATFPVRRGQKLSSNAYDIGFLESCGVKLREVQVAPRPVERMPASVNAKPPAAAPGPDIAADVYEVLENIDVPRDEQGHGTFRLSQGQRITSSAFDITKLEDFGVRMRKIEIQQRAAGGRP